MSQHQVHDIRGLLLRLADLQTADARRGQGLRRAPGREDPVAQLLVPFRRLRKLCLVRVPDRDDHVLMVGQVHPGALEGLAQSFLKICRDAQTFAGGLHLRPQGNVRAPDLLEGENRHLDGIQRTVGLQPRYVSQFLKLLPADHLHRQRDQGDPGDLGNVRHGAGGPRVHLDDPYLIPRCNELDVDHAGHVQRPGQFFRIRDDGLPDPV